MLKTIIFDMDGVIIDSEPQHAKAALRVFNRHGADADYDYCASFIGSSTEKLTRDAILRFQLPVSPDALIKEMNAEKKKVLGEEGYQPLPGIIDLIRELYQSGVRLAIASSSSIAEIESTVKALGIRKYFTKLISSSHVREPKPAPDTFLLALKELGCSARETVVVEDSCFGTQAAKAAGIVCVGYVNPHSGKQDLSAADVLLESFETIDYRFFKNVLHRSLGEPVTIANTKRLKIRELTAKDMKDIYQIYQNPEITKYIPDIDDYLDVEMEKQNAYIRNVYSFYGYGIWGVFSKTTKQLIGRCGIENLMVDGKQEITLSYLLDSKHWGYGYALECCRAVLKYAKSELDITRVVAVIDTDNSRSIHTAKNLGMILEKNFTYKGRDCYLYAISL
ncbi:MAG: GNAT family N-acetyltransferase [Clostridiaceae bacterium]|nr:GNAT family N-acetyltransferase [Clostridiaceae bacterium]